MNVNKFGFAFFSLCLASSAFGSVRYVKMSGNDGTAEADNPDLPYATVAAATAASAKADEVHIFTGTYAFTAEIVPTVQSIVFRGISAVGVDADREDVILDGGGVTRAFNITSENGAYSVFRNLTFSNFSSTALTESDDKFAKAGGAVRSFGTGGLITFSNCLFSCCSAAGYGGGAIACCNTLAIDCEFRNNTATPATPAGHEYGGGAVYGYRGLGQNPAGTYRNCTFIRNRTNGYGGAATISNGGLQFFYDCTFVENAAEIYGGALDGSVQVSNCTFRANVANGHAGAIFFNRWTSSTGSLNTMRDCDFIGNVSTNGAGALHFGSGCVSVFDSSFVSNVSVTSYGGAIRTDNKVFELVRCTFDDNLATNSYGGAIHGWFDYAEDCKFRRNRASQHGGAWHNTSTITTVNTGTLVVARNRCRRCRFEENRVAADIKLDWGTFGGAICLGTYGSYVPSGCGNYSFDECDFVGNSISNLMGKSMYGGALCAPNDVTLSGCSFVSNALYAGNRDGCLAQGSAIWGSVWGGMSNCTLAYNRVVAPYQNASSGGALALHTTPVDGWTEISKCLFLSNSVFARYGGAVTVGQAPWLRIRECDFIGNHNELDLCTNAQGAVIFVRGNITTSGRYGNPSENHKRAEFAVHLEMDRCRFIANRTSGSGGCINAYENQTTNGVPQISGYVRNTLFDDNRTFWSLGSTTAWNAVYFAGYGAVAYLYNQPLSFENCTFRGNLAGEPGSSVATVGGAIHSAKGTASLTNCVFYGNADTDTSSEKCDDVYVSNGYTCSARCCYAKPNGIFTDGVNGCIVSSDDPFQTDDHCELAVKHGCGRDAGDLLDWMTAKAVDLGGKPRVRKEVVDFGCYEFWRRPGCMLIFR